MKEGSLSRTLAFDCGHGYAQEENAIKREREREVSRGGCPGGGKCPTFCWRQRIDLSAFHLGFSAKPRHSRFHSISLSLSWYSACKKINHCNISIPGSISEYSFTTILTQPGPASYSKAMWREFSDGRRCACIRK